MQTGAVGAPLVAAAGDLGTEVPLVAAAGLAVGVAMFGAARFWRFLKGLI